MPFCHLNTSVRCSSTLLAFFENPQDSTHVTEITDQMHQRIEIISVSCHQDLNQCDHQRELYPFQLGSYDKQLHIYYMVREDNWAK